MRIGYLGPKGTFSYEACCNYYNQKEEMKEFATIQDVIVALEQDKIDEAIVPIENSIEGCVTQAIDTLIENECINVKAELILNINQNLMSNKKLSFDSIEKVYSHPQAIAQCRKFLEKNLPHAEVISVESTALAAKQVSQSNENIACIGNIHCVEQYALQLIQKNIQDNDYNKTRFWILNKNENNTGNKQKMSMLFSVKDKPGALYNVLKIFNKYNLNLTKIESRPAKTVLGEYIFWIDVTLKDSNEDIAIEEIRNSGVFVRVLGKY